MTGKVLTYSPKDVKLIIAGYTVGGLISVTVSWNQPRFKVIRGAYGKITRVRNFDTGATMRVELLQTAIGNTIFSDLVSLDHETDGGKCEITLKDLSGKSIIFSDEAYCENFAEVRYSGDFDNRVWTFNLNRTSGSAVASNERTVTDVLSSIGDKVSDVVNNIF